MSWGKTADLAAQAYAHRLYFDNGMYLEKDSSGNLSLFSANGSNLFAFGPTGNFSIFSGNLGLVGKIGSYENVSTAGIGISTVYQTTFQKSENAADANVLTYTPPSVAGSYKLFIVMSVSAATAGILGWTATWHDANGGARAPTNLPIMQASTGLSAATFTLAAADVLSGVFPIDIDNSANNIVIKLTLASGSFTALVSAWIEQVQ